MKSEYDAIIIGTGQACPSLANRLNSSGMTVAAVERDQIGGSCVNYGCIPTKALVASARVAHMARRASEFGVKIDPSEVRVDMSKVKSRMERISGDSRKGATKGLENLKNVELIRGDAKLTSAREVAVGDRILKAEKIFLNVGTKPLVPEIEGLGDIEYLTNKTVLELDEVPKHLIIIGGSYIGLEFGQIYRRFGSEVTIVEKANRLIYRDDPDVSQAVQKFLEKEGIQVRCETDCLRFAKHPDGVSVQVDCRKGQHEIVGSHVLVAVGRVPNTDNLGLDVAGVATNDKSFIEVDDRLQTTASGIWALGDCNGRGAFTHTAYNDYEIVAANLLDDDPRNVSDRITCYGLFTDPPLGRIGMTEKEARDSGRNVLMGKLPMKKVGRAHERSETYGFMKVLVDGDSKRILGAAILGINGDEVVHALLDVMYADAPYTVISRAVHIHPTVTELLPKLLQDLEPLT